MISNIFVFDYRQFDKDNYYLIWGAGAVRINGSKSEGLKAVADPGLPSAGGGTINLLFGENFAENCM